MAEIFLQKGDISDNGALEIIDEDRLCFLVRSTSKGAIGLRTISKALLEEYIDFERINPNSTANDARKSLCGNSDIDKFEYGYSSTLWNLAKLNKQQKKNRKIPTNHVPSRPDIYPRQQIWYGAPGTGKSHEVNELTDGMDNKNVFRTTFHPDSDYSTFVGCYKPQKERVLLRNSLGAPAIDPTTKKEVYEEKITYKFEPQAFVKAYVRAYQTDEPVALVIEEINRGNCAQIFGDIFQLLDRKDGVSEYPVKPDSSLNDYLKEVLGDKYDEDRGMVIPSNLHIWATMNTSDQSLFPIDSAFKRRWDWKYVPINTRMEDWYIEVGGEKYSWSIFLEKVNKEIFEATNSEDKQLGFYFCKATAGVIGAERFVYKVLFYLYNDVFKDYGLDRNFLHDAAGEVMPFKDFFTMDGNVNSEKVKTILENLEVTALNEESPADEV